ncbi:MAG TPA: hypothetical protein PLP41_09010 [Treponemataceae bacterium]|nr:hypothetical protein [Treponemataceae bacterium]
MRKLEGALLAAALARDGKVFVRLVERELCGGGDEGDAGGECCADGPEAVADRFGFRFRKAVPAEDVAKKLDEEGAAVVRLLEALPGGAGNLVGAAVFVA